MHKSALVLAVTLAACFTLTDAQAAKKRKAAKPADAAYEWNVKNVPPMATPGAAAKPVKVAKASKKKAKKS